MKAAVVKGPGQTPVYDEFPTPEAEAGTLRIAVEAAALSQVVRSRASGTHYSSGGVYPFVAGVDGIGRCDDGRRFYFGLPQPPFGAMAEIAVVAVDHCATLPDGLDAATAAALANPGMSSWLALTVRAHLVPGETVLINGATGTAGRLAVEVARHLGAGRIIATGRNADALAQIGADATVLLLNDRAVLEQNFAAAVADGVDVVLDYLWGMSAQCLLVALARADRDEAPTRFVEIGAASGPNITLPAAVLRSSAITLMGSGIGSIPFDAMVAGIGGLLQAAAVNHWTVPHVTVPLSAAGEHWTEDDNRVRTVFVMGDA